MVCTEEQSKCSVPAVLYVEYVLWKGGAVLVLAKSVITAAGTGRELT